VGETVWQVVDFPGWYGQQFTITVTAADDEAERLVQQALVDAGFRLAPVTAAPSPAET
jgi:hypothetical protein